MTKPLTTKRRSDCPISFGLDLFGDKWSLLVLRDIILFGRDRYSDFMPHEHVATNILADRLERLEATGIITKRRHEQLKNQYVYQITDKGLQLVPTIIDLMLWGLEFDDRSPVSAEYRRRIREERSKTVHEITESIQAGTFADYRRTEMKIADTSATSAPDSSSL